MGSRYLRSTRESFRGMLVVFLFHVVNEAQLVVEMPIFRIVPNPLLYQIDGSLRHSSAVRRLRGKKIASVLIGHNQFWIEGRGDFQQRREQLVARGSRVMLAPEILYGSRPIDVGQQAVVSQT